MERWQLTVIHQNIFSGLSKKLSPTGTLFLASGGPPKCLGPVSGKSHWGFWKCYREPTKDNHSNTVYNQLRVFILILELRSGIQDPSIKPSVCDKGFSKAKATPWYFAWQLSGEVLHKEAVQQKLR